MVKWRSPWGKWASYAIYGSYAFIGWNLIPIVIYNYRKKTYEEEYSQGLRSKRHEDLNATETYFAFFNWRLENVPKFKADFKNWTIEELPIDAEPCKYLHEIPESEQIQIDNKKREDTLKDLRKNLEKVPFKPVPVPGDRVFIPANTLFE